MENQKLEGQWKQVRGKIKEQWGELTDDDLDQVEGKRDQLVGRIQQRYGEGRDAIEKKVSDIFDRVSE